LIKTFKKYIRKHVFSVPVKEKEVVEAYDLWSEHYDSQPGNLMLDLDEILLSKLFDTVDLKSKHVADIGCGTGRHWAKILQKNPESLTGFDVSSGMLNKLGEKFPAAKTHVITDNNFSFVDDGTFDVILSTLTVAHIENIEEAVDDTVDVKADEEEAAEPAATAAKADPAVDEEAQVRTVTSRDHLRQKLEDEIKRFLSSGGHIEQLAAADDMGKA